MFWVRGMTRKVYFKHLIMPRVDGVVGVSRQTMEEVYELYELSAPGELIPNGIDLTPLGHPADRSAVRESLDVPRDRLVVLFFGALTPQKRPDRFVRLLRRLHDAGLEVIGWMLGDGEARGTTEALAEELGVKESVRFLGYRSLVADYVAASDLFASTSDSEGIPAAVLEAGYLRLPVVGFDVGGMRECVLDGATGYLAPPGDEDEHFRLVKRLLQHPEERHRLGEAARTFVVSEFAIESVGRRYELFYERLLGQKAP
jgi:glycosyltransferase involved in cell wall biosynthesis